MSCIDSDLEEGEIPDDSPSSPHVTPHATVKKVRELPRRYILRENKSTHKHKKHCKYAIRYHAKKLAKLKKTPNKGAYKKHRKSCPHKLNVKYDNPVSEHLSKNGLSFSKHSLLAEMKCMFNDFSVKKSNLKPNRSDPQIGLSETKNKTVNNLSISETSKSNKNSDSRIKSTNVSVSDSRQCNEHLIKNSDDLPHLKDFNRNNEIKDAAVISHESPDAEVEESEDEEELRRIALATCAKRKLVVELSENSNQNVDSSNILAVPESSKVNIQISPRIANNLVTDNYEVVDMEVDDDTENSVDIVNNESLFVIDTQPSSRLGGNVENSVLRVQHSENSSDVDFEADILRAELIGSMFHKRTVLEQQLGNQKANATIYSKQMPVKQEAKISVTYKKPNINLHHKSLIPARRPLRKNSVNKLKRNSGKLAHTNQVNKSPKRLIITLNGESSSEESDDGEEVNSVPENPVASIEALISDCRQKSDSNEKTNEVVKHVPKALSCLSKAQQEEYNSLLKILAERKKLPVSQETFHHNNSAAYSPLNDLKILEGKLLKFEETLKKKKLLMKNVSNDVNTKKQTYMKSKLSAQHLKEQYVAAEKVRRIKLDEWSKSCHNFEGVKKSISSLESKIIQLQNLCSKLGSAVQGQTYNLPSVPTDNGQL